MDQDNNNRNLQIWLNQLERQLEHGSYFNQTVLSQYASRINEIEAFLFGLIDMLEKEKKLDAAKLQDCVAKIREEVKEKGEALHAGIALRIDREEGTAGNDFVPVNCNDRIHICNAICCKLNFALSGSEIESGNIKWDIGRPYFIRHEKNGYCTHMNEEKKCCSVYNDRPKVCSGYSCAKDERIWKDFDNMVLNSEWIEANLHGREPKMFLMDIHQKL